MSTTGARAPLHWPAGQLRRVVVDERGSATVWLLLIVSALFAFAGLVLDGGRVITARQEAANLAEQAARTAVDQLDQAGFRAAGQTGPAVQIDPGAAQAAACGYVGRARPGSSCTTSVGADGRVQVDVAVTTRMQLLGAAGVGEITVDGTGDARPAIGATQEVFQ